MWIKVTQRALIFTDDDIMAEGQDFIGDRDFDTCGFVQQKTVKFSYLSKVSIADIIIDQGIGHIDFWLKKGPAPPPREFCRHSLS